MLRSRAGYSVRLSEMRPPFTRVSNGNNTFILQHPSLCPPHPFDRAAQHHLDGSATAQGVLDRPHVLDVGRVRLHPAADAAVQLFQLLNHQRAARIFPVVVNLVEGDDEGVAELGQMPA